MEHSDPAAIKKSVRTYMMVGALLYVGTVITVAANQVHLAIPLAIPGALIISTIKGSAVAAVFMHLSHEKKWIYGSLILTVAFFVVLMSVPFFTISDSIGTPLHHETAASAGAHEGHWDGAQSISSVVRQPLSDPGGLFSGVGGRTISPRARNGLRPHHRGGDRRGGRP